MLSIHPTYEEKELLARLRGGDYQAFETIYHYYKRRMASAMLRMLKSPDVVEDLLQELFIRLWERRHTINPDQSLPSYLFRIAENLVYDTFRKLSKDKKLQQHLFEVISETYTHIEEEIVAEENRKLVSEALALLPPRRREVYVLCKLESKSYEEVSSLLQISPSTVNDHIYKANQFLKRHLTTETISLLFFAFQAGITLSID